jgi:hypothetical protein
MGYLEVAHTMEQTLGTGGSREEGLTSDEIVTGWRLRSFATLRLTTVSIEMNDFVWDELSGAILLWPS